MKIKYFLLFLCLLSVFWVFTNSYADEPMNIDTLNWQEVIKIKADCSDDFTSIIANSNLYIFLESLGYFYCPIDKITDSKYWKAENYPKSFPIVHSAMNLDGYIYFCCDSNKFYSAKILGDGSLSKYERQFYERKTHSSWVFTQAYGRFYYFARSFSKYDVTTSTIDGFLNKWKSIENKNDYYPFKEVSVYNGKLFFWSDRYSNGRYIVGANGVVPISEDLSIGAASLNAVPPDNAGLICSLVANSKYLYLLTSKGDILSGEYDSSGTIYEWVSRGKVFLKNKLSVIGDQYRYEYGKLIKTTTGLIYIYIGPDTLQSSGEDVGLLKIYSAKLPDEENTPDPFLPKNTTVSNKKLDILKPESKITLLKYFPETEELFAWDDAQKSLLISKDEGVNWEYTSMKWEHDNKDNEIYQIERLPNIDSYFLLFNRDIYKTNDFASLDLLTKDMDSVYKWVFCPEDEKIQFLLTYNGVYKTGNTGKNWLQRDNGLNKTNDIYYIPWDKNKLIAVADEGAYNKEVFITTDNAGQWIKLKEYLKNEGFNGNIDVIDPKGSEILFNKSKKTLCFFKHIINTWDDIIVLVNVNFENKTIKKFSPPSLGKKYGEHSQIFTALMLDGEQNIILIGSAKGLYRISNGYKNNKVVFDSRDYALEFDKNNPNRIWSAGIGQIKLSEDAGKTWKIISGFDYKQN